MAANDSLLTNANSGTSAVEYTLDGTNKTLWAQGTRGSGSVPEILVELKVRTTRGVMSGKGSAIFVRRV